MTLVDEPNSIELQNRQQPHSMNESNQEKPIHLVKGAFVSFAETTLLLKRFYYTFLYSPKFFFAAFFWQAFGFIALSSGNSSTSTGYYFLTGVGTMLGILLVSFVLIAVTKMDVSSADFLAEVHGALLVGSAGGITAGTLWQVSVNIAINQGFNFSGAFFFVFMMSGTSYFLSAILLRYLNNLLPKNYQFYLGQFTNATVLRELTLAISVGVADAFFVGTDNRVLRYGWLVSFRIADNTPTLKALCLAGSSALCGYMGCQSLLNISVAEGILWLDESDGVQQFKQVNDGSNEVQEIEVDNPIVVSANV